MAAPFAYFDTSVLLKQYLREPGAPRARALLRRHRLLSSVVAPIEAVSALSRRRTAGDVTERDFVGILARMRRDRAYWELVELAAPVLGRAEALVQETALQALDALHVASALIVQGALKGRLPFITADARQSDVARTVALDVVWVE